MSIPQNIRSTETNDGEPEAISAEDCRRTLQILRDRKGAITEAKLAERLASMAETDSETTDSSAVDALRIRLQHRHLPKLADAGLVDWDRDARTVAATDRTAFNGHRLDDVAADDRGSIATLPADGRRRQILAILESENGSITREALARELAEDDADGKPATSLIERIAVRLHHARLPKLDDAGLLEYDPTDGTIASRVPTR